MKKLLAIGLTALAGCMSGPRYTEGTMTQIGLYVPVSGQIYGLQCLNYLNGCQILAESNQTMKVERCYSATNNYFGIIQTVEGSRTKVEVR